MRFPDSTSARTWRLGDLNGDGANDIVVAVAGHGGPEVKVYDGAAIAAGGSSAQTAIDNPLKDFYAFAPTFTGGVNVAVGNIPGFSIDPTAPAGNPNLTTPAEDIVVGAGPGGGPQVKVFNFDGLKNAQGNDLTSLQVLYNFYAYDSTFHGGVNVAAGNVGGDTGNPPVHNIASDEVVTGAGITGRSQVNVYAVNLTNASALDKVSQFYAYGTNFFGGVNVSVGTYTNNRDATTQAGLPTSNVYADIVTELAPAAVPRSRSGDSMTATSKPATRTPIRISHS